MTIKMIERDGKKFVKMNGEDLLSILPDEVIDAVEAYKEEHDFDDYLMGLNHQHGYTILIEE